jgi:hypothetical protein
MISPALSYLANWKNIEVKISNVTSSWGRIPFQYGILHLMDKKVRVQGGELVAHICL